MTAEERARRKEISEKAIKVLKDASRYGARGSGVNAQSRRRGEKRRKLQEIEQVAQRKHTERQESGLDDVAEEQRRLAEERLTHLKNDPAMLARMLADQLRAASETPEKRLIEALADS